MRVETERELLMMLFANTQLQIELIDSIRDTTFFKKTYKDITKKLQNANIKKIQQIFKMMDNAGEDKQMFEFAFAKSTEACETLIKAVEGNTLENLIAMLRALSNGEIKQMDETKHKKIMNQLETLQL